jgi:hypothetical protein
MRWCLRVLGSQLALFAVQPVSLYPILIISVLLYRYEQLMDYISQVEQMIVKVKGVVVEE